eukprot:TRINITY_DN3681_c0_g2_i2.p1 TRINITY_DN3681_c0_g2~~TRINITY_DN3681_c0_g2_i2.p1  ORF type:complete len:341 (-),score=93.58 TRINITY_DN3681_c0_g2_i2:23-1045(-)
MDRVSGLFVQNNEVIVNAIEYYDAPADNTETTRVIRDKTDLKNSVLSDWYHLEGRAKASGWVSKVPNEWKTALGGNHIFGYSSGQPIIGRLSVGPSAFIVDIEQFNEDVNKTQISSTQVLGYSLTNKIGGDIDLSNSGDDRSNKLWTHLSSAVYGFIIPDTSTYFVIGTNGGFNSGVLYKGTDTSGRLCGGYCAADANDYSVYYWLFDVNDLVDVKEGTLEPYEVEPYQYGSLNSTFSVGKGSLKSCDYDYTQEILYCTYRNLANGEYSRPASMVGYSLEGTGGLVLQRFGDDYPIEEDTYSELESNAESSGESNSGSDEVNGSVALYMGILSIVVLVQL